MNARRDAMHAALAAAAKPFAPVALPAPPDQAWSDTWVVGAAAWVAEYRESGDVFYCGAEGPVKAGYYLFANASDHDPVGPFRTWLNARAERTR